LGKEPVLLNCCHCVQIAEKVNLRKEGFILAHDFRITSWWSEDRKTEKEREREYLYSLASPFPLSFHLGPQPTDGAAHLGWVSLQVIFFETPSQTYSEVISLIS
jgi:hypothetical protein